MAPYTSYGQYHVANHYLFDYADEVTDDINDVFKLNIGQKIMTLGEIKKILEWLKNTTTFDKNTTPKYR